MNEQNVSKQCLGNQTSFIVWVLSRGIIPIVFAVLLGAAFAVVRHYMLFVPGVQGMICGALAGWFFGSRIKKDKNQYWNFGQTHWHVLNITIAFFVVHLLLLSYLNFPSSPFITQWLGDIVQGAEFEKFVGASFASFVTIQGSLSGTSWLLFNILDCALFFFLAVIATGVARGDTHSIDGKKVNTTFSRRFFIILWLCFAALSLVYSSNIYLNPPLQLSYSERIAQMQEIAGIYTFNDGATIVAPKGVSGEFILSVRGTDMLMLQSKVDKKYSFSLTLRDGLFKGMIHNYSPLVSTMPVTGSYNQSNETFTLSIRPFTSGSSRQEITITATKNR